MPPAAALQRDRLHAVLDGVWSRRLAVVVAPAGSGKTTLLAGFASSAACPVAWYRAETWDGDERTLLRHVEAAITAAIPGVAGGWSAIESAAAALDAARIERALLVVDDAHTLEGTPAEQALGRLVEYAPPWLSVVVGSRLAPGINLSRLRVADELVEIGPDDLRFRAWEVERLFRDHYADPVPPDDLAILARRTEGWAAGLQLFHLATRGKSADERRRIVAAVGSSSRLVREYLTWNVMADLRADLREFLVETCVLGRLTGSLCDRLLDRTGSRRLLDELFRRQIFTVELDEADGSYRYHEVLRSHLDRMLVERVGEAAARERYRRAAVLLDEAGAAAEALAAYSRAEDWDAVRRLLGGQGERLVDGAPTWLERLPPAIVRHEPWLELAVARRARGEGRWSEALEAYGRAEAGFGTSSIAFVCHRERQALRQWFEPVTPGASGDWVRLLRMGLTREPLAASRDVARHEGAPVPLVCGLLQLAAGEVGEARRSLVVARGDLAGESALASVAGVALGVARLLAGDAAGALDLGAAEETADAVGVPWLARIARAATGLDPAVATGDPIPPPDPERDPWGSALLALIEAWNPGPGDGQTSPGLLRFAAADRAAIGFRGLGSGVLEAWARALASLGLAETGAAEARETAVAAESVARSTGAPGVRLVTYRALAIADESRRDEHEALAATVGRETGLSGPPPERPGASAAKATPAAGHDDDRAAERTAGTVGVRTLGGFEVTVGGVPIALDAIRPRARALLRLLAVHVGGAVHREVIADALWPEADAQTAARSLQVAVSAIRGMLADAIGPEGGRIVAREGDAYRLAIPPDAVDVGRFELAVAEARGRRVARELRASLLVRALAAYGGDLLPEDGPADWVIEPRERYRGLAVEVAREAAEATLVVGDARSAIDACRAGLSIDRYHDPLWRLLIEARQAAGDVGAADRDRREYESILVELGVSNGRAAIGV